MPTPGPNDSELALLAPGEFVLNREAAAVAGKNNLNALNQQGLKLRNQTALPAATPSASLQNPTGLNINPVASPLSAPTFGAAQANSAVAPLSTPTTGVPQVNPASATLPSLPTVAGTASPKPKTLGGIAAPDLQNTLYPKPTFAGQNPVKIPSLQTFNDGGEVAQTHNVNTKAFQDSVMSAMPSVNGYEDGTYSSAEDEELARRLKANKDSYPADPKRFGYQGVPSDKQLQPAQSKSMTTEPPPAKPPTELAVTEQPKTAMVKDEGQFRYKRSAYNRGQQAADFRAKYGSGALPADVPQPKGGVDPWIEPTTGGGGQGIGQHFKNFFSPKGNFEVAKNIAKDPVSLAVAGHAANEALLNRETLAPNTFERGARTALDIAGNPAKLMNAVAGKDLTEFKGPLPNAIVEGIGKVGEALFIPPTVRAARQGVPVTAEQVEALKENPESAKEVAKAAEVSPLLDRKNVPLNIYGKPVQQWTEKGGFMVGGSEVIPWDKSDTEGLSYTMPAEEFQALQQQKRSMADQKANSVLARSVASNERYDKDGNYLGGESQSSTGGFQPQISSSAARTKASGPTTLKDLAEEAEAMRRINQVATEDADGQKLADAISFLSRDADPEADEESLANLAKSKRNYLDSLRKSDYRVYNKLMEKVKIQDALQ